ncbi:hypothetical protein CS542_00740 [Pedobacter sp. IW39]|nr:hypothetical protein CS542_00740 [Pedobacter sp. IW39]
MEIGTIEDEDRFYQNTVMGDQAYCDANGIDYQACILPGDSGRQRQHGNYVETVYIQVKGGVQEYTSMFDEFNEGIKLLKLLKIILCRRVQSFWGWMKMV